MTSIIKVDNLQNQCGANIISESANVITIGASGDTVTLAAGASQSGFGRSGSVNWDTTPKTSSPVTAVSGNGYFINTTSGAITVNLPSTPAAGDIVAIADYANTSATNNITVGRNGSKIDGENKDAVIVVNGQVYTLVYVDATEGWKTVSQTFNQITTKEFVAATGGTITTCGNFKIHSFTGPGTFTVTNAGNPGGSATVDYMVVAGGGSGGSITGGGGGAGGLRTSTSSPVTATAYPITIGAGGAGVGPGSGLRGNPGNNSVFSTITSTGGGGGGGYNNPTPANAPGGSGGSGGGSAQFGTSPSGPDPAAGGAGNTPPVSPPQGNPGSGFAGGSAAGSGGGAGGAGIIGTGPTVAGVGGVGFDATPIFGAAPKPFYLTDSPNAGTVSTGYFAGGGGGSSYFATPGPGGLGGGGLGGTDSLGGAGIANSGGGAGGGSPPSGTSAAGGSGIVLIKYKYQ
jgi:hypothetical protein